MVWLAQLTSTASYGAHVLPALLLLGVGIGSTSAPAMFTATYNVPPADAGVASAMVNTMQQAGGAIGASVLSTIFASAVSTYLHTHTPSPQLTSVAAVHGYTTAFWVAAATFAAGAILIATLVPSIKPRTTPKPTPAHPNPRRAEPPPRPPPKPSAPADPRAGLCLASRCRLGQTLTR
jgi:MFS family permease